MSASGGAKPWVYEAISNVSNGTRETEWPFAARRKWCECKASQRFKHRRKLRNLYLLIPLILPFLRSLLLRSQGVKIYFGSSPIDFMG